MQTDFWLFRWMRQGRGRYFWLLFFAIPLLSGVIGRLAKGRDVYHGLDFETILCAGRRAREGQSMFPPHEAFGCVGSDVSASYVYLPWVAEVFNSVERSIGLPILFLTYSVLFFLSLAVTIWVVFFARFSFADRLQRWPFMGMITGSVVLWGNIAGPIYALLALAGKYAHRLPIVMLAVIVLAGAIKQVWLVYLLFFLTIDRPYWQRGVWFISGAVLGLLPTAWFLSHGGAEITAWRDIVTYYGAEFIPGQGFLGWVDLVGLGTTGTVSKALWFVFAGVMCLSAIVVAEANKLSSEARCWLAFAVATLINPRLVAYEFWLLAPGIVLLCGMAVDRGAAWVRNMVYVALVGAIILSLVDLADYAIMPALIASSVAVIFMAWVSLRKRMV